MNYIHCERMFRFLARAVRVFTGAAVSLLHHRDSAGHASRHTRELRRGVTRVESFSVGPYGADIAPPQVKPDPAMQA